MSERTAGATRAMKAIRKQVNKGKGVATWKWIEEAIDREAGLPELLKVAQGMLGIIKTLGPECPEILSRCESFIRAAVEKVEGKKKE